MNQNLQETAHIREFIKESLEQNNKTLLAEFNSMLLERDKGMLAAIAEQRTAIEVMDGKYVALKDEFHLYRVTNDKFKDDTRQELIELRLQDSSQNGMLLGAKGAGKAAWIGISFLVGVGITLLTFLLKTAQ